SAHAHSLLRYVSPIFTHSRTASLYTLSLHDALPIFELRPDAADIRRLRSVLGIDRGGGRSPLRLSLLHEKVADLAAGVPQRGKRSEEHTSELQSREKLVCRLLLEKKKTCHRSCLLIT